jgi:hypothetical protein
MVLLKRPAYRALFEGYLELHRAAAVRIEDPALDAPLDNLPHLYQLWATLHVIDVAIEVATSLGFVVTHQELVGRDASGLFIKILRDGRSAIRLRHPASRASRSRQRSPIRRRGHPFPRSATPNDLTSSSTSDPQTATVSC